MNSKIKSYYAILPAEVRYSTEISSSSKLLYAEITALCNKEGFCWASNSYFAELYKVSRGTISKWIKQLEQNSFIRVVYMHNERGKNIDMRKIYLSSVKKETADSEMIQADSKRKQADSKMTQIIIKDNTKKNNKGRPEDVNEVVEYFVSHKADILEANKFFNYFESNGWKVGGRTPMKNWKAAANNWMMRSKEFNNNTNNEFPDYYDRKVEYAIGNDSSKLNRYHKHLRNLGWTCVHSPTAGTIWKKK
jgi:DNA-binding PadR family transcriptional regulator